MKRGNIIFDSIIVFLRYPVNGQVKTRLAKTTSLEFAFAFYKNCAEYLINVIKNLHSISRFVFFYGSSNEEELLSWLGKKFNYANQVGDDLGCRMKDAFEKVFKSGAKKVILVGTDIPDLTEKIILDAFALLDTNDVVIGPSKDGGYYLLGLKKMYKSLFDNIEYSTSSVLSDTLIKVKDLNLTYNLLPVLQDIDTEEDLINWLNNDANTSIKEEIKAIYYETKKPASIVNE